MNGKRVLVKPDPDPTLLTTELVGKAIDALRRELEPRFEGIADATKLLHEDAVRVPTDLQEAIKNLRELLEQKMDTQKAEMVGRLDKLDTQMGERDRNALQHAADVKQWTDQKAADVKEAVKDAFAANKETANKSEQGLKEQINSVVQKADDLKERIGSVESLKKGGSDVWNHLITLGAVMVAIAAIYFKNN